MVVVAGMAVTLHAESTVSTNLHEEAGLIPPRHDVKPLLDAASALLSGRGAFPFYGDSVPLGYAPPYVALFTVLAWMPRGLAYALSVLTCAGLTVVTLGAWARRDGEVPGWFWAIALSLPVVALVRIDQLMSAVGLAAITAAIFAQRRGNWWLAGAMTGLALIRTANALPILAMLLVVAWNRPRNHALLLLGMGGVLVPLGAIATLWDGQWVQHYLHNLQVLPVVGPLKLVREGLGVGGTLGLQLGGCLVAAALGFPDRGRTVNLDRAAMALALTLVTAVLASFYPAVFVLPGIIQVAKRPGMAAVAWIAAFVPWLVILAFTSALLGPRPLGTLNLLTMIDFVLLAGCYPLLRLRPTRTH